MSLHAATADRGREARKPTQIPARGWLDVLMRVKNQLDADNVSIVAAGLALYSLLAIFPALTAVVLVYGLFSSPAQVTEQLQTFGTVLPQEGLAILQRQLTKLTSQGSQTLGAGLIVAVGVALWSARRGVVALMIAANVAYDERETRGFFRRLFVSLAFTLGAVLGLVLLVALGVAVPVVLNFLPLGGATTEVLLILRWVLLWLVAVLALAVVYRLAPDRSKAQWQWVSWGSGIAATLWLAGSVLFALYVRNFGSTYGETYGALGGVIVMLLWLLFSAYTVVLGAEINSELERQTRKDSTDPPDQRMGERGAYSADTLGPTRKQHRSCSADGEGGGA